MLERRIRFSCQGVSSPTLRRISGPPREVRLARSGERLTQRGKSGDGCREGVAVRWLSEGFINLRSHTRRGANGGTAVPLFERSLLRDQYS